MGFQCALARTSGTCESHCHNPCSSLALSQRSALGNNFGLLRWQVVQVVEVQLKAGRGTCSSFVQSSGGLMRAVEVGALAAPTIIDMRFPLMYPRIFRYPGNGLHCLGRAMHSTSPRDRARWASPEPSTRSAIRQAPGQHQIHQAQASTSPSLPVSATWKAPRANLALSPNQSLLAPHCLPKVSTWIRSIFSCCPWGPSL